MLIFLDIDGVLHPADRRQGTFSCLREFESLVRQFHDVEIVISSSWRIDYSIAHLRSMFSRDIAARIIGVTPDRSSSSEVIESFRREREIEDWLRENGRQHDRWVALDDCEWMYSPNCTQLVKIDPISGFDERAARILGIRLSAK